MNHFLLLLLSYATTCLILLSFRRDGRRPCSLIDIAIISEIFSREKNLDVGCACILIQYNSVRFSMIDATTSALLHQPTCALLCPAQFPNHKTRGLRSQIKSIKSRNHYEIKAAAAFALLLALRSWCCYRLNVSSPLEVEVFCCGDVLQDRPAHMTPSATYQQRLSKQNKTEYSVDILAFRDLHRQRPGQVTTKHMRSEDKTTMQQTRQFASRSIVNPALVWPPQLDVGD